MTAPAEVTPYKVVIAPRGVVGWVIKGPTPTSLHFYETYKAKNVAEDVCGLFNLAFAAGEKKGWKECANKSRLMIEANTHWKGYHL